MSIAFLACILAVYVALLWHCAGNFSQHHVLGQIRRRWALYATRSTLLGLKLLFLAVLLGGGFHLLHLMYAPFAFITALSLTLGIALATWVAPACLLCSLVARTLELVCGTSFGSSTQEEGTGLSASTEEEDR